MKEIIKNIKDFEDRNILNTLSARTIFVNNNIDKIFELTNYLPITSKIKERLYIIYHHLTQKDIKCPCCDKNKKFYTFTKGYNLTCSQSCSTTFVNRNRDKSVYEKRKETYNNKSKEEKSLISKKKHNTSVERYGQNYTKEFGKHGYINATVKGTYISGFSIVQKNNPEKWTAFHKQAGITMLNNIDENGNNHYDRIHLKKVEAIDENGNNYYDRIHLKNLIPDESGNNKYQRTCITMIERGYWTTPEDKEDLAHYYQKVWKVTRQQPIHTLKNIENRGHANKGLYHLDHMYSISEGFRNNIPIHLIGNIANLKMIIGRNNISKGKKCSISLETLIENINKMYIRTSNDYPVRE